MDPHAQDACGWIRLLMANLNLVLGSLLPLLPPTPYRLQPPFDQVLVAQSFNMASCSHSHTQNWSTRQSRAWKENHKTFSQDFNCHQCHQEGNMSRDRTIPQLVILVDPTRDPQKLLRTSCRLLII